MSTYVGTGDGTAIWVRVSGRAWWKCAVYDRIQERELKEINQKGSQMHAKVHGLSTVRPREPEVFNLENDMTR